MARVNNSYYAILGILSVEPMSGYQIKSCINGGVGYFLEIDYKQIYPALKNIVADGLATYEVVKTEKGGESKRYKLTDAGFYKFREWMEKPITNGKQMSAELLLKLFYAKTQRRRLFWGMWNGIGFRWQIRFRKWKT